MTSQSIVVELLHNKGPEVDSLFRIFSGETEMARRMRAFDWSQTPLGPVAGWPQSLRTALGILLSSGYPMYIAWGREFIQFYNDAYRPILGQTKHPALGRSTPETFPEIWDFIGPMFNRVIAGGEATTLIDQLLPLDRNGYVEECYFTFSYSAVRDAQGGEGGVFVTVLETTARVVADRRGQMLRELARRPDLRSVDEVCRSATEAFATNPYDVPFAFMYLPTEDGKRAHLAGAAGIEPCAELCPDAIDLVNDGADRWRLASVARDGKPQLIEGLPRETHLSGSAWPEPTEVAWVQPVMAPGQSSPALLLVLGVSPRKRFNAEYQNFFQQISGQIGMTLAEAHAYQAERQRAEALAELDRAKTLFFTNISHEFRTPLTLMLGPVEDILSGPRESLAPADRERLQVVHHHSLRLLKLVNTLLDFSRIEARRTEALYERTDISVLTGQLASVFRSAVEKAGLRFLVDCQHIDAPVYVDRDMWEKIVLNLLSNALKFTFDGEIAVRLQQNGDLIDLTVRDTGVGIPTSELQRVFDRFHRIEGTKRRSHEGSGIGLALVVELAKLHGGSVGVESQEGQGSTFRISIPLGSAHLPADRLSATRTLTSTSVAAGVYVDEAMRWLLDLERCEPASSDVFSEPEVAPTNGPSAYRPRVVIADDNADMRDYLARLLHQRFSVEPVADGVAALKAIRRDRPELILTDVMMPQMDGFELLASLRDDPHLRSIPVILLSARAGEEARIEGVQAGADDYIIKPFNARELIARVASHIELAAQRRQAAEALHLSEERFAKFMQHLPGLAWIKSLDGRYVYANAAATQAFGVPSEQLLGKTDSDLFSAKTAAQFNENDKRALAYAAGIQVLETLEHKDGTIHDSVVSKFPIPGPAGEATLLAGIAIDITERKQAVDALRESEERFRLMAESAPVMIWMSDAVGKCVHVNRMLRTFWNVDENILANFDWATTIHSEDRGEVANTVKCALAQRGNLSVQARYRNRDGDYRILTTEARPRFSASGDFLGMIGVNIDVTETVKANQALSASDARLRIATKAAGLGVFEWDVTEDSAVWENERMYEIFGHTPEDGSLNKEKFFSSYVHPDDKDVVDEALLEATKFGASYHVVCRVRRKNGDGWRWIESVGELTRAPDGTPVKLIGVAADVTERQQAEEALRESEARFRSLVALSSDWYWEQDENFRFTDFSSSVEALAGSTAGSHLGKTRWELPTVGVTEELWAKHKAQLARHEPFRDFEYCRVNEQGETIWMSANGDPIFDFDGRFKGYRGTGHNITMRRRAEQALRESEHHFRLMANTAPAMLWINEVDNSCSFRSRGWYRFTGQDENSSGGSGWLLAVHPDDHERVVRAFEHANANRETFTLDYRLRRADGEYCWVVDTGRPRYGVSADFLGHIGSVIDITARKKVEERQQLLLAELNHRVKNTLAIVQSIAAQTLRGTKEPTAFKEAFSARLAALARAHSLLTKSMWESASLVDIVSNTLSPFSTAGAEERIQSTGPSVSIEPNAAVTLCLVLHELATNAAKHGALSTTVGRVKISWRKSETTSLEGPRAELCWREENGPSVQSPERRGFGSRLIEASADQLGGRVAMEYHETGLVCRLQFPLRGATAPTQTTH
ncbi:MAG: PAS domain S-box protein [Hyphomicrobiaceae bacterium]